MRDFTLSKTTDGRYNVDLYSDGNWVECVTLPKSEALHYAEVYVRSDPAPRVVKFRGVMS